MNTLEQDLQRLGAELREAIIGDCRRRQRRRRRIARLALPPVLALTVTGAAAAVVPLWNQPAPPAVQRAFDDAVHSGPRQIVDLPTGSKLGLWAQDGDQRLYGTASSDGSFCVANVFGAVQSTSSGCRTEAAPPADGEVRFDSVGGAPDRQSNVATGRVSAARAVSVEISIAGQAAPIKVGVGHDGWFIAQLPDSTLGSASPDSRPPAISAAARDADGNVVARSREP